jgi:hypothetical protein
VTGTFHARMDELSEIVGTGFVVGKVTVDQVYAHYQHERLDLRHPRGGMARYLTVPLYTNRASYLNQVAKTVLNDGGIRGMCVAMEHLAGGTSNSTVGIKGLSGGALGALKRLPAVGGMPTIGESGTPGEWGVAALAPVQFGDLRDSGHPQVFAPSSTINGDGVPRYDRQPRTHRLTEYELKAKAKLLPMDPRLIGWIWYHVMHMPGPPPHGGGGSKLGDFLKPDLHRPGGHGRRL